MAFFLLQQHDIVLFFKSIFYFSTRYDQFIKQYQLLILTNTTCFACLELLSLWKSTTFSPTSHHFKLILNLGNVKF